MEALIEAGVIAGSLDVTTTEFCDLVAGGALGFIAFGNMGENLVYFWEPAQVVEKMVELVEAETTQETNLVPPDIMGPVSAAANSRQRSLV